MLPMMAEARQNAPRLQNNGKPTDPPQLGALQTRLQLLAGEYTRLSRGLDPEAPRKMAIIQAAMTWTRAAIAILAKDAINA